MMALSGNRDDDDGGEGVISIVGPQMEITGDVFTDGSVRIEGTVTGNVRAEKAVVVGKDGAVDGDIQTQDAIVTGRIQGSLTAASRLEIKATARIDGDILARRVQLDDGAMVNGNVQMSDDVAMEPRSAGEPASGTGGSSALPGDSPAPDR